jgi:uncharacterized protein (TIGR02118 family)
MTKGMIKVNVLYPNGEGKKFDMDYYCNKHVPMAQSLMGDSLKGVTVEKGLAGGTPDSSAPHVAIGSMYFDSVESFQKTFATHGEKLMTDVPNFTDIEPVIQISGIII